jgi:hypothetical protein
VIAHHVLDDRELALGLCHRRVPGTELAAVDRHRPLEKLGGAIGRVDRAMKRPGVDQARGVLDRDSVSEGLGNLDGCVIARGRGGDVAGPGLDLAEGGVKAAL